MIDELNTVLENSEGEPSENELGKQETQAPSPEDAVSALKAELQEANDKFMRLYAEFDNFKRRTMKEKSEYLQTAGKDVILALLPVVDDFERAHKAEYTPDFDAYRKGIELIHQKFAGILQNRGLKSIDSIGEEFNVDVHEAITNVPAPSPEMAGKVIDETEKGYTLNGHVIRFAKVIVGE